MRLIPDKIRLVFEGDITLADFHSRLAEMRGDTIC